MGCAANQHEAQGKPYCSNKNQCNPKGTIDSAIALWHAKRKSSEIIREGFVRDSSGIREGFVGAGGWGKGWAGLEMKMDT